MNIPMIQRCAFYTALLVSGLGAAWAQPEVEPSTAQISLAPSVYVSSDSDQFKIRHTRLDMVWADDAQDRTQGFRLTDLRYQSPGLRAHGQRAELIYTQGQVDYGQGLRLAAGLVQVAGQSTWVGDLAWAYPLNQHSTINLEAQRNVVESESSLPQGIASNALFGGIDYQFSQRWLLIGMAGHEAFSDNNRRQHLRTRVIFDLLPQHGVAAHWRYRRHHNSSENRNYFNPQRYQEHMLLLSWRERHQGWLWYALLGVGQERVNQGPSTGTRLLELTLSSPEYWGVVYSLNLGYNNSSNSQRSDRYSARHFRLTGTMAF